MDPRWRVVDDKPGDSALDFAGERRLLRSTDGNSPKDEEKQDYEGSQRFIQVGDLHRIVAAQYHGYGECQG